MKRKNTIILIILLFLLDYNLFVQPVDVQIKKIELNTEKYVKKIIAEVSVTMYNAVESQCDDSPLITAGWYYINPKKASEHKWIAVSRNLLKQFGGQLKYGDKVQIKGCGNKDGDYTVVDTMNKRFVDKIDILETVGTKYYKYDNVTIFKI